MQQYLKAVFGATTAGLGQAYATLAASGHINWTQGVFIALTTLTTFGAVLGVTNAPTKK